MRVTKHPFVLPYEPAYDEHRKSKRARDLTRLLQRVHENKLHESPSIVPDQPHSRRAPRRARVASKVR